MTDSHIFKGEPLFNRFQSKLIVGGASLFIAGAMAWATWVSNTLLTLVDKVESKVERIEVEDIVRYTETYPRESKAINLEIRQVSETLKSTNQQIRSLDDKVDDLKEAVSRLSIQNRNSVGSNNP